jgi:hypothetical protein
MKDWGGDWLMPENQNQIRHQKQSPASNPIAHYSPPGVDAPCDRVAAMNPIELGRFPHAFRL